MANVNDAGDLTGKHARRYEQVEEADIPERDRELILAFHKFRKAEGMAVTTLTTDLSTLRNASERATVPLVGMSKTDVENLFQRLVAPESEGGYGLAPDGGGMYNYKRTLRVFFRWLNEHEEHGEYPFWDGLETPSQNVERKDEEELLTPAEVEELKEAAGRGRNTQRDRALVAFLADGPRVTLASQLRVGDVDPYGNDPYWRPNEEAVGHKGMDSRRRTFLWSKAEVRSWLSHGHPDPDNPEAPLWVKQGYDPDNPQEGALSPDGIRGMLERAADRAGIEKAVNPHSFRHAAMTRLSNDEGLNPQQIQHLAGWADQRMLEVYDRTSDESRNNTIRDALGMPTSETEERETPDPRPCHNCRTTLHGEAYCPECGEPQEVSAQLARDNAKSDVREGLKAGADDPDKTAARADVLDQLESNPDALDAIADALGLADD